jgi:hypothetical protein
MRAIITIMFLAPPTHATLFVDLNSNEGVYHVDPTESRRLLEYTCTVWQFILINIFVYLGYSIQI